MIETFAQTLLDLTISWGYFGVLALMAIESSFIPFPSEIIIPPAAYLASKGEMNVYLVVLFGIFGSLTGALINYYLAMWLGRPLVYSLTEKRWSKLFLLNSKKVEKAEKYFLEYGGLSTFLGRLIPAIRQLISLPAGFTRMKLKPFVLYTSLGAGIWVIVLAALGYYFGENEELIKAYSLEIGLFALGVAVALFGILYFRRKKSH